MSKTAKISTRTVGQKFATAGVVRANGRIVHETRDYPYGYDANAYDSAKTWAEQNGYRTIEA